MYVSNYKFNIFRHLLIGTFVNKLMNELSSKGVDIIIVFTW